MRTAEASSVTLRGTVTASGKDLGKVAALSVKHLLEGKDTIFIGSVASFQSFRSVYLDTMFSSPKFQGVPRTKDFEDMLADRHLDYASSFKTSSISRRAKSLLLTGGVIVVEKDESVVNELLSRESLGKTEIFHLV